jgi:hypothetical protein
VSVEIGWRSRAKGSVNEDAYLVDVGHLLFGVFDGVGATLQAAQAAPLAASRFEPPTTSTVRAKTAHPSERSSPSLCGAPKC